MADGYYWVWFYNHQSPIVMKRSNDKWLAFDSDAPDDEIDFVDRPPQRISEPSSVPRRTTSKDW